MTRKESPEFPRGRGINGLAGRRAGGGGGCQQVGLYPSSVFPRVQPLVSGSNLDDDNPYANNGVPPKVLMVVCTTGIQGVCLFEGTPATLA